MGNQNEKQCFQRKYQYFQNTNDRIFGECRIFRENGGNLGYVMEIQRYLTQQNIIHIQSTLQNMHSFSSPHSPFLKIVQYNANLNDKLKNTVLNTCNLMQLNIYVEFLRHNLREFVQWRKLQAKALTYQELTMICDKAIKAYQFSQFFYEGLSTNLSLNLEDISVTVEGEIKFNPLIGDISNKCASNFFFNQQPLKSQHLSLKETVMNKRALRENISQKATSKLQPYKKSFDIFANDKEKQQICSQIRFLSQLKKLTNELIWDERQTIYGAKNHEQHLLEDRKQIKRLLTQIHRAKSLKQIKELIGNPTLRELIVDMDRLRYEQFESKFQKMAMDLSQKSDSTDVSRYQSLANENSLPQSRMHNFQDKSAKYFQQLRHQQHKYP